LVNRRERRAASKAAREARSRHLEPSRPRAGLPAVPESPASRPDALYRSGIRAAHAGRLEDAERCLGEAVALRPGDPNFHHALGLLRTARGRFVEAVVCHDKALALQEAHIGALIGRADALHELGRLNEAEIAYRGGAGLAPRAPEIRFGWATVLADLGRLAEAAQIYRDVLALSPSFVEAHVNLGTVLRDLGQTDEAVAEFQAALALKPSVAHAVFELVSALSALGRSEEAVERATQAMRRDPRSSEACRAYTVAVARNPQLSQSAEVAAFLERCLASDDVEHEDLARASALQLRQKYRIDPSPAEVARRAVEGATAEGATARWLADPLLLRLLAATVNTDLGLEVFLTEARRQLCLAQDLPPALSPFLAALALQSFNNGYVFMVGPEEQARVDDLRASLERELSRGTALYPTLEQKLLRFALYEPLTSLAEARPLAGASISAGAPLKAVLRHCLAEPLEETALARDIPSLETIEDTVSQAVRDQYEQHPYPRWLSLPRPVPVSLLGMLRRKFPHAALPAFLDGPIEVLVAGCGTGRQPIATALSLAQAHVLAVDLSRASLAYAKRMALRLGAANVSFLHADLLALGALGRKFPLVEAVGVLHHMKDPMAGWGVLRRLLRPGGFMRIGLYSALARAEVITARQRIAALGLEPTAHDIRAFRSRVLFGHEALRLPHLSESRDMFDLNGCRDLLFHASEHRFSLPDVRDMLVALELEFLGFEFTNDNVRVHYRATNPDDPTMTDLTRWARFEKRHTDAFSGMYIFWCRDRHETVKD
jgi:tetratricopeptide (TPR) repeat protein